MAKTKDYSTREKVLDKYLQDEKGHTRKELQALCNKELLRRGEKPVTARTTILDDMREIENKYNTVIKTIRQGRTTLYHYKDPNFSIFNAEISDEDYNKIFFALTALKRLYGIPRFSWLDELEARLGIFEKETTRPIIMLEDATGNSGINYFQPLFYFIVNKQTIRLFYKNFKMIEPEVKIVYPYLLKQYNNRWFLIGTDKGYSSLSIYALDRIIAIEPSTDNFIDTNIDFVQYFEEKVGVSTQKDEIEKENILFKVVPYEIPYIKTKPIHKSQQLITQDATGAVFSIKVQINFELEQEFLAFSDFLEVLSPMRLRERMKSRILKNSSYYQK